LEGLHAIRNMIRIQPELFHANIAGFKRKYSWLLIYSITTNILKKVPNNGKNQFSSIQFINSMLTMVPSFNSIVSISKFKLMVMS